MERSIARATRWAGVLVVVGLLPVLAGALDAPSAGAAASGPTVAAATAVDWGDLDIAGMTDVGDADGTTPLIFYLGLAGDDAGRAAFARAVSDPASPFYGAHLTVAQVAARYGASTATQAAVVQYFAGLGLAATVDVTGTYASVTMPLSTAETVFGADWRVFTPSSGFFSGLDMLYPTATPTLPSPLVGAVVRVHGAVVIDDLGLVPPSGNPGSTGDGASLANITGDGGTGNRTGTPQGCAAGTGLTEGPHPIGMAPNQVLDAYGIDDLQAAGFRGEGTRVAVVDDSIYEPAWLDGYRACFGLADATPVTPHVIGTPSTSESGETILDLSVMSAVAPKVDRFDVFMVDSTINPEVIDHAGSMITMFGAPLDASRTGGQAPDVISASFGLCEALDMYWAGKTAAVAIMEDVLATAAAAGISYLVSTGDSGSSGCQASFKSGTPITDPAVTVLSAQYPATSAWVTAVGGTNLTLDPANEIVSSGVWNDQAYTTPGWAARPPWSTGPGTSRGVVSRAGRSASSPTSRPSRTCCPGTRSSGRARLPPRRPIRASGSSWAARARLRR